MEKEVKRLYRMDNEATDVQWEVVMEADKEGGDGGAGGAHKQVIAHGACKKSAIGPDGPPDMASLLEVGQSQWSHTPHLRIDDRLTLCSINYLVMHGYNRSFNNKSDQKNRF